MKIYSDYANIELTEQEAEWLRLPETVPADELKIDAEFSYRDFADKLTHAAREVHHATGLTVMIGWGDCEIAQFNENGLNYLDRYYAPRAAESDRGATR